MVDEHQERIMEEAHSSIYSIHPDSTKMYRDLREVYWWNGIKKDIAEFVAKCLNCQQVKVEHQRPGGLAQNIELPEWKVDRDKFSSPSHGEGEGHLGEVSPMKGVMRFGKKGKLSPRYIGPYRIVKRIGNVAYELELPQELAAVHPDNLSYEEIPVQILDRQVRKLRTKEVASVKVLWRNQFLEEATWEAEENIKKIYPHLFE
ncbi:hypothetical protein MTR67_007552 [Solanum verrucosum]|uniref:Uncharacterized protein n=1 Tax=Solanum verrucosum TaxID=315347 RepID=A0AAF0TAT0_SOLVR|nr:hypothetical protein MTR67_007552 [Solanum verrucosum]